MSSTDATTHRARRQWWRDAVVYQIYPRSFHDSNNDGEGDLAGVTGHIDYIKELGVDAIWLNPCYRSPMRDGGYDVADYRDIDPRFGTLTDFDALVGACHERGVKVIMDLVPNHCSSEHPWFQQALATAPGSDAWARFHCVPGRGSVGEQPPNDWQSVFSGSAWSQILDADGRATGYWYLHLFDSTQPDLNWEHPQVRAEFEDIIRFWFDRGVDGLRIDVATGMIKAPGYPEPDGSWPHPHWDQDGVHEIYRAWRAVCNEYEDRVLIAEAILGFPDRLARYIRADELHMAFNFSQLQCPWDARAFRDAIEWPLRHNDAVGAPTTWLLENHDIARAVSRYSGAAARVHDPQSPTILDHVPIRELDAEQLARGTARARAALLMTLALPGSFYLYAGGELGLPEVLDIAPHRRDDPVWHRSGGEITGRDGCRVPLPWTTDGLTYGFNTGHQPWLPQPSGWGDYSVAAQSNDAQSFLAFTRAAIALRHRLGPATDIRWHDPSTQDASSDGDAVGSHSEPSVLDFTRSSTDATAVRIITNFGSDAIELPRGEQLLRSDLAKHEQSGTGTSSVLPPDACVWLVADTQPSNR